MILYPNNPKSHHLLKPARVVFLVLWIMLLLGACTTPEPPVSQVVIITPTDTSPPPPSPTPTTTPQIPTLTPFPEGAISLALSGFDPESLAMFETWARKLSETTGLNVIVLPVPETDMEVLEALRDGRIHMTVISPLAYLVGNEQGWVEPGPIMPLDGQEAGAIMFISRTDTGFLPGEPPEVFQQLEGWRVCWPETKNLGPNLLHQIALSSYILPLGLLRQNGVEDYFPVLIEGPEYENYRPKVDAEVFRGLCDFAAIEALSPEDFLNRAPASYINLDAWKENMQILYTTEPINPFMFFGFSPTLPEDVREQLAQAILANPGPYPNLDYLPFNETLYDEFRAIALASELDLQSFLTAPPED